VSNGTGPYTHRMIRLRRHLWIAQKKMTPGSPDGDRELREPRAVARLLVPHQPPHRTIRDGLYPLQQFIIWVVCSDHPTCQSTPGSPLPSAYPFPPPQLSWVSRRSLPASCVATRTSTKREEDGLWAASFHGHYKSSSSGSLWVEPLRVCRQKHQSKLRHTIGSASWARTTDPRSTIRRRVSDCKAHFHFSRFVHAMA